MLSEKSGPLCAVSPVSCDATQLTLTSSGEILAIEIVVSAVSPSLTEASAIERVEENGTIILAYPNKSLKTADLSKTLSEKGIVLTHLAQKHKSLEEQFLTLTQNETP